MASKKFAVLTDQLRDELLEISHGHAHPGAEVLRSLHEKCLEAAGDGKEAVVLMRKFLAVRWGMMLEEAKKALECLKVSA